MKLALYQIDAFAKNVFEGNPAAICPLETWLPDVVMQAIAAENNLAETAFYVATEGGFHIRWFTPITEVDLCGHATLACAFVIFNVLGYTKEEIKFESRSGVLVVKNNEGQLEMDFPSQPPVVCNIPQAIREAFADQPIACLKAEDYIVIFEEESSVKNANPDLACLLKLDLRGVAITAQSEAYDFVTRFFAPRYGIDEDPVTGSAFTQLVPYWAEKLGKQKFHAKQISKRGGEVVCELAHERIKISGSAVKYMEAVIVV